MGMLCATRGRFWIVHPVNCTTYVSSTCLHMKPFMSCKVCCDLNNGAG